MRDVLQSVTSIPGVQVAAVFSDDGLPLCILEADAVTSEWHDRTAASGLAVESLRIDPASIVAFAASWVEDLCHTGASADWGFERRFTLVATEGTLVVQLGPAANVLAVLEPGVAADSVAFPMEVAVERLQRLLRGLGRRNDQHPPAPLARAEGDGAEEPPTSNRTTPVRELMDHTVGEPGAAADVPATGAASHATNRPSGDH